MNAKTKTPSKNIYLTIVNYVGGQIDNSLKSTVVLNASQFLFAYGEEDKGFVFKEYSSDYSTDFSFDKLKKVLGLKDASLDDVIDALYELEDHGFEDSESGNGATKFAKRVTGNSSIESNKVDPRGVMFS